MPPETLGLLVVVVAVTLGGEARPRYERTG